MKGATSGQFGLLARRLTGHSELVRRFRRDQPGRQSTGTHVLLAAVDDVPAQQLIVGRFDGRRVAGRRLTVRRSSHQINLFNGSLEDPRARHHSTVQQPQTFALRRRRLLRPALRRPFAVFRRRGGRLLLLLLLKWSQ